MTITTKPENTTTGALIVDMIEEAASMPDITFMGSLWLTDKLDRETRNFLMLLKKCGNSAAMQIIADNPLIEWVWSDPVAYTATARTIELESVDCTYTDTTLNITVP
jgi:hypothetical protein